MGGLVGAIVAGGITAAAMTIRDEPTSVVGAQQTSTPSRGSNAISGEELDIRALLDKVQPSVVSIHTGTRQGEAAGSGIVLSEDGLVLTNAHVVSGAESIQVDFADGQTADARLIGAAPESDVALVKAEGLEGAVVPAELGSSDDLLVGDEVVAIGNALNLGAEPSVTLGIVSQTGRSIQADDGTVLDDLIQTDAAINPRQLGRAAGQREGQVVGVNTAILADAQNIGFALEIDSIRELIDDLKAGRDAEKERAVLGVRTLDVSRIDNQVAQRFGVTATSGAFVQDVDSGSGAEAAGMLPGDVIVELDGKVIRNSTDVSQAVRAKDPGDSVVILVEREGEETSIEATLGRN
ncbi:MAG: trypsin-like peptidase domain-containing protein [Microthrixaceae bacterium]|nr:trypsin-like peptidase domain-containing protein [Microthrixaceae bacterium]